jgi:hypothetical protein
MSPNVRLSIELIVLDGITLTGAETTRLRGAMQRELTRLLRQELPAGLRQGGAVPTVPVVTMGEVARRERPEVIGVRLARAVHRSLAP